MAEPEKVPLNFFCPDSDVLDSILVDRNADKVQIERVIAGKIPGQPLVLLVDPGKISADEIVDASDMRSALSKLNPKEDLHRLSRHNLEPWWPTMQEGDLHLIARPDRCPCVNVFDTETRKLIEMEPLRNDQVHRLLPPGKNDYDVYRFPEGTKCSSDEELGEIVDGHGIETLTKVTPKAWLKDLAPWGFIPGELHFVIVPPGYTAPKEDTLQPLPFSKRRRVYFDRTSPKAPSSEAKVGNLNTAQESEAHRIHCGRPYQRSTPPTLLDETLCRLRCDVKSITPTPEDTQCFERLRATASMNFEDEAQRREEFTDILTNGGILPSRASRGYIGSSRFYDGGDLRADVLGIELIYYVQEVKHEIGTTDSDPYVEAIHYWLENVRYFMDHTEDNPDEARFNLPAIIVLHFGPYLAIVAAVYGEEPNVEHLCCIPLHAHTTNEAELQGGERALAALRVAVHALRDRYPNLPFERSPRADFPFRDFYEDDDGKLHRFTYIEAIEEKRIFRVRHEDGTPLCVKFSKRYSAAAHRAAHSAGFAPALRAVNEVYDWTMVVMDDKTAEYPKNMWDIKVAEKAEKAKKKPTDRLPAQPPLKPAVSLAEAQKQVQAKLAVLHEKGFVHGDLRDVNVLVRKEDAPGDGADILIVDWDWAGVAGEAKYPRSINPQIVRPVDALAATNIKPEHDVWMAARLLRST